MTAKLSISIERDSYTLGEQVRGQVLVHAAQPKARSMLVAIEYAARRIARHKVITEHLHSGPLQAGSRFDFTLTIPLNTPFSFEGTEHKPELRIVAEIDVPWALDPRAVQPIEIAPLNIEASETALTAALQRLPAIEQPAPQRMWILYLLMAPLMAPLALLSPLWLYLWARKQIQQSRIRDLKIIVPQRRIVIGEQVPIIVRFSLVRSVRVEALMLSLCGAEHWTTGSGNNRSSKQHTFHQDEQRGLSNVIVGRLPAQQERHNQTSVYRHAPAGSNKGPVFEWHTHLLIPHDGLPSVGSHVRYALEAKLKLTDWPDMSAAETLHVSGVRLAADLPPPEDMALSETIGHVAIVPTGDEPPRGMEPYQDAGPFNRWLLVSLVGSALAVGALLGMFSVQHWLSLQLGLAAVVALGLLTAAAGFVGMRRELNR